MSQSPKLRRSSADKRVVAVQHILDIIDVLFAIAENGDKAVSDAIAGHPAFQRLYRYAAAVGDLRLPTPHSDPENGVAQEDETILKESF